MEITKNLPKIARDALPLLSTDDMREVDRLMIEDFGIVLMQMMENAGRNLANLAQILLGGQVHDKQIHVLSGRGNNGGGGLVAARHLSNRGAKVSVFTAHPKANYEGVALHQYQILDKLPVKTYVAYGTLSLPKADLIIDAIIGYGLRSNPRGFSKDLIDAALDHNAPVLSLDTPSGLDTATGEVFSPCITALATMTLALPKAGLLAQDAAKKVGDLYLADISVPPSLYQHLDIELPPLFAEGALLKVV